MASLNNKGETVPEVTLDKFLNETFGIEGTKEIKEELKKAREEVGKKKKRRKCRAGL